MTYCEYAPCGQSFEPTPTRRQPQRFCSSRCRYAAWVAAHPRTPQAAKAQPEGVRPNPAGNAVPEAANTVLALAARVAELEAMARAGKRFSSVEPATGWKHGANCYRNHGCRCAVCLEGHRIAARRRVNA